MPFVLTGQCGAGNYCPSNTLLMTADHRPQRRTTYDALSIGRYGDRPSNMKPMSRGHTLKRWPTQDALHTGQPADNFCNTEQVTADYIFPTCDTLRGRTWPEDTTLESKLFGSLTRLRTTLQFHS